MQMSSKNPLFFWFLKEKKIRLKSEAELSKPQRPPAVASSEEGADSHAEGLARFCCLSWGPCRIFSGPVTLRGHAHSSLFVLRGRMEYKH